VEKRKSSRERGVSKRQNGYVFDLTHAALPAPPSNSLVVSMPSSSTTISNAGGRLVRQEIDRKKTNGKGGKGGKRVVRGGRGEGKKEILGEGRAGACGQSED